MPDQKSVNISVLAGQLASTLRAINNYLYDYDNQYKAHPVEPIGHRALTLITALEKKLNTGKLEEELEGEIGEEEIGEVVSQARNAINSLQEFHFLVNRLKRISDDIAKKPSVQDLGVFRTQWDECCLDLVRKTDPLSQVLDSLSETAATWRPVALPAAGQAGEGETDAGADTRTRDKTGRKKKAS